MAFAWGFGPSDASPAPQHAAPRPALAGIDYDTALSQGRTLWTASVIRDSVAACETVGPAYRVDCLAEYLGWAAGQIPSTGDYAPARRLLAQGAVGLARLARGHADPGMTAIRPQRARPLHDPARPLRALRGEAITSAGRRAEVLLDEMATALLRSAGSEARRAHFQQIAEAVASLKVLLRSS